jgi:hypothetical protein
MNCEVCELVADNNTNPAEIFFLSKTSLAADAAGKGVKYYDREFN